MPKLKMADGIISIGVNPYNKSNRIFPIVAPKAPYGPNNKPKTNNNPTWGLPSPISKNWLRESATSISSINIIDIAIFFSLDFIIPLF